MSPARNICLAKNKFFTGKSCPLFSDSIASRVRAFHEQMPSYKKTPLVSLPNSASTWGLKSLHVKDESKRLGLNAFKVLGSTYAIGQLMAKGINTPAVFATATAGNHGIGVAWAARELGQSAIIYLPKGSRQSVATKICNLGAKCVVTQLNYDDTVRLVSKEAQANNWLVMQDTAWPGYQEIPTWISQGYMTMADEALEQFLTDTGHYPSHIFIQAGVGSMAGGVLGYFASKLGSKNFTAVISEPSNANCIYRSGSSSDGSIASIKGDCSSVMSGLACGELNPITWPIIRDSASAFICADDAIALSGVEIFAHPQQGDPIISGGPSGAINMGLIAQLMTNGQLVEEKEVLGLDSESRVLIFNTEASP